MNLLKLAFKSVFLLPFLFPVTAFAGGMNDDPLLAMAVVDQLELRDGSGKDPVAWDAEGWIGRDLDKLWIKSEGEYRDGRIEEAEAQILYSRAVAPYWDLQAGWRRDIRPTPARDWLALGVKGLAPYFFDLDAAVFVADGGRSAVRLKAAYEIMFSQRLILVPDVEVNLYGRDDEAVDTGSGLASVEAGLRLRYEIRREFAPYVGVNWIRLYGDTADYAADEGADIEDTRFVFGVRAWY